MVSAWPEPSIFVVAFRAFSLLKVRGIKGVPNLPASVCRGACFTKDTERLVSWLVLKAKKQEGETRVLPCNLVDRSVRKRKYMRYAITALRRYVYVFITLVFGSLLFVRPLPGSAMPIYSLYYFALFLVIAFSVPLFIDFIFFLPAFSPLPLFPLPTPPVLPYKSLIMSTNLAKR